MPALIIFIQNNFGSPSHCNQEGKRKFKSPNWKIIKTVPVEDMILHIESHKDATQKLLELISEVSQFAGYKINTLLHLYTLPNKRSGKQTQETIPGLPRWSSG